MNPVLFLQLKRVLASLTAVLTALMYSVSTPTAAKFGSATVTAGNSYPTSTYSFSDNDIINAGDLNNISTYTGIRSSTDTVSLQGQIYNVSSTSYSLLGSTTSTVQVSHGGTATTLFTNGLVFASGTNAFSSVNASQSGMVPISSGNTWTANSLAAGGNITITTSSGGITISGVAAANTLTLLASSTLISAPSTGTITASWGSSPLYIHVVFFTNYRPSGTLQMELNKDGGNNYDYRAFYDGSSTCPTCTYFQGAATGTASFAQFELNSTSSVTLTADISNTANNWHVGNFLTAMMSGATTTLPHTSYGTGNWENTNALTSVTFTMGATGVFGANTILYVYGNP